LGRAREKAAAPAASTASLYTTTCAAAIDSQRSQLARADALRGDASWIPPEFFAGSAENEECYSPGEFDVITCCGSVLSFVEDPARGVTLAAHALAPGGRLFLEVEQRSNLDLVWPLVDWFSGGRLGYEQNLCTTLANLLVKPGRDVQIVYPMSLGEGATLLV